MQHKLAGKTSVIIYVSAGNPHHKINVDMLKYSMAIYYIVFCFCDNTAFIRIGPKTVIINENNFHVSEVSCLVYKMQGQLQHFRCIQRDINS